MLCGGPKTKIEWQKFKLLKTLLSWVGGWLGGTAILHLAVLPVQTHSFEKSLFEGIIRKRKNFFLLNVLPPPPTKNGQINQIFPGIKN